MEATSRQRVQSRLAARRLPTMVIMDVTNTCNLACVHCPQPTIQSAPGFRSKHLDWAYFEKIVEEVTACDEPVLLRFTGDGEPTVHPRLFDMLLHAKSRTRATVNLTTNGVLMTPKRIDALLAAGIDVIDFSIDALSKPVYDAIRIGGDYERLHANIDHLLERRAAHGNRTRVMVSFIVQDGNRHEVDAFAAHWKHKVDEVMVRLMHSAVGMVKAAESRRHNRADQIERYPCPHLWKRLTVDFRGDVKFCAHEWAGNTDVILGNMATNSLGEIWRGKRLAEIRTTHEAGDHRPGFICTDCTDWAASRWEAGFERLIDRVVHREARLMPELPIAEAIDESAA